MKLTKSELKSLIKEALREELAKSKRPLKEAVSSTYEVTYDKLAKKFMAAVQEADKIWTTIICDYGCELGYYTESVNKRLKAAAKKNILAGVTNDSIEALCITGISKIDDAFSDYVDQEGETFDEALGDACYCETFICYADGSHKYFNLYEDTFTGNTDDIECIIGIDYASGATIAWIRGEDDEDYLENYLNI